MAKFSFLLLLGSIVCSALATVPATVYRADKRDPDIIKEAGGFAGFGTNMDITIVEHVTRRYEQGHRQMQDPWVSTSELARIGCQHTVGKPCWVYRIDTAGISAGFKSANEAFAAVNKVNGNSREKEWATTTKIPLSAIKSFYKMTQVGDKFPKQKTYTWETWEAKKTTPASRSTASSSKKTSRDETTMAEKDGILVPVAFHA